VKLSWPDSSRQAFVAVAVLALVVRLVFLFVALPLAPRIVPGFTSKPGKTFDGYHDIAVELIEGRGYALPRDGGATAARAPLYPVFLAGLYTLFGRNPAVVLAAHALLGALTCGLTLLLGWRLYGRAVGLIAGLVLAFHPMSLWWSQYVLSETMLTLLLTLAALGLARFAQLRSAASAIAAGALVGLAALCNSVILAFPLVLLLLSPLLGRGGRPLWRGALLVACAALAIVLRNAVAFHQFIPVNWGYGFQAFKGWADLDILREHPNQNLGTLDSAADRRAVEALRQAGFAHGSAEEQLYALGFTNTLRREEDALLARLAGERQRRDPGGAVAKLLMNMRAYWTLSIRRMEGVVALNLALLVLAIVGIAATVKREPARWLPIALACTLYLMYSAIIVSARFALQVIPIVAVYAGAGALWLIGRIRVSRPAS